MLDARDITDVEMLSPNVGGERAGSEYVSHKFPSPEQLKLILDKGYLKSQMLEIGGGLGHVAYNFNQVARNSKFKINKFCNFAL